MPPVNKTIKISRSGLKLFLDCPRCFWLDVHHKIKRPPSYPYTLSAAVDYLVKQEFDKYRVKGELPPVFAKENLNAKLFSGPELPDWRNNFKGISYFDEDLNGILYGAIDDILEFNDTSLNDRKHSDGRGSLAVVDYKSSGSKEISIYDDYQKQMDIYTYILQRIGYKTQPNAYFVFYQVEKDGGGFSNALPFKEILKSVEVNPDWVSDVFQKAVETARQEEPPINPNHCGHCHFVEMANKF